MKRALLNRMKFALGITSLAVAMGVAAVAIAGPPEDVASGREYEVLQGFDTVVINQVNDVLGTEHLPQAMGYPVEPGMYVTMSKDRMTIFDEVAVTLQGGASAAQGSPDCKSGCPADMYDAFRRSWLELADESASVAVDMPTRVLFAVDGTVSAQTLVQSAYAASEARTGQPPSLHLLLNAGKAGLRARPFMLLPPEGLRMSVGDRILGLRIKVEGAGRYTVTAADPRFGRTLDVKDKGQLMAVIRDIKKRYPNKETVVLDAGRLATVNDIVGTMVATQEEFKNYILSMGQALKVG